MLRLRCLCHVVMPLFRHTLLLPDCFDDAFIVAVSIIFIFFYCWRLRCCHSHYAATNNMNYYAATLYAMMPRCAITNDHIS